jgi:hypothetical protein
VNKKNTVAKIIFIIGCIQFVIGFIAGLAVGGQSVQDPYYGDESETVMNWSIVFAYWGASFVTGMLFIALAEIIEILDDNREYSRQQLQIVMDGKPQANTESEKTVEMKPDSAVTTENNTFSEFDRESIKDFFKNLRKETKEIIGTPLEDFVLVLLENGEYVLVELGGFKPEIIPHGNWNATIKRWFDQNFKS